MANPEHLKILLQGSEAWNDWREANDIVRPDLSEADLERADLRRANLSKANLERANLRAADIRWANLRGADLREANLIEVKFFRSNLSGANLREVDLTMANLVEADFTNADLTDANITNVDLIRADLRNANLNRTILALGRLIGTDLRGANLTESDLSGVNLIDAKLDGAILTDTTLWETQRHGWSIQGVTCERAFWDREGKEATAYEEGVFERAYADKYKIEITDKEPLHPLEMVALPFLVEELQKKHPGYKLHIQSVSDAGSGARIKIAVDDTEDRSEEEVKQTIKEMKGELAQERLKANKALKEIETYRSLAGNFQKEKETYILEIGKLQKDLFLFLHREYKRYDDLTVLFLDLEGFSQLKGEAQNKAAEQLWALAAGIAVEYEPKFRKTWGDAIFCAFEDVNNGLAFACKLIETLKISGKSARIGLSFGQIQVVIDTFSNKPDVLAKELSAAARLEPMADAFEVLVTGELQDRREIDHDKFTFEPVNKIIKKPFADYKEGDSFPCYRVELKETKEK